MNNQKQIWMGAVGANVGAQGANRTEQTETHVRELSQIVTIWVALELAVIDFFKIIF